MKESDKHQQSERGGGIAIVVISAVLVLYVLSLGPAVRCSNSCSTFDRIFQVIYSPLEWLNDNTVAEKVLNPYVEWWTQ